MTLSLKLKAGLDSRVAGRDSFKFGIKMIIGVIIHEKYKLQNFGNVNVTTSHNPMLNRITLTRALPL